MKIEKKENLDTRVPVGNLEPGTAIINGEGNLCMIMRRKSNDVYGKIPLVNLENGDRYSVSETCRYAVVKATVTWEPSYGC